MPVKIEDRDDWRLLLLDRPERRNALDMATVEELAAALESAPGRVVVLGSTDPRSFSAGADLTLPDDARAGVSRGLYELYGLMRAIPQIIVAAASGHAVGGGAQLLLASDLRISAPDLTIRFAGAGHGLVVGAWGLPSLIGRGRALDLCLSMRPVDASEALAIGLVDRVVDEPLAAAIQYAEAISTLPPLIPARVKHIVGMSLIDEALGAEAGQNSQWDGFVPRREE